MRWSGLEITLGAKFKETIMRSGSGSPLGLKLGAIVGETILEPEESKPL